MKILQRRALTQSGTTLAELVVALVITGIVLSVVSVFVVDKLEQSTLETIRAGLLSSAENGIDAVANDIRLSTHADDNNRWQDPNAPGAPSDELSWQSNSTTLVLAIAAEDSHANIIFDDPHDYVSAKNNLIYYLSNGSLYRRTLADPVSNNGAVTTCPPASATPSCPADIDVLDNVSAFSVQYYDGNNAQVVPSDARSIQLSVTLTERRYNQDISVSYTTRMVFRNG